MRRTFVKYLENKIEQDPSILLITADLGYGMFDNIKTNHPNNFVNCIKAVPTPYFKNHYIYLLIIFIF